MRAEYQESVKEKILKTAEDFLQEKGIDQVTLRNIANKLGCSVGSIYNYFSDKKSILKAVYSRTCRDFLDVLKTAPRKNQDSEENFIDLIVVACTFRIQNSHRYREILHLLDGEESNELMPIRSLILKELSNLKLPALSTPDELQKADRTLLTLCEGAASIYFFKGKQNDAFAEMIHFALHSLLTGWKKQKQ